MSVCTQQRNVRTTVKNLIKRKPNISRKIYDKSFSKQIVKNNYGIYITCVLFKEQQSMDYNLSELCNVVQWKVYEIKEGN